MCLDNARAGLSEQRRQDGRRVKNGLAHRWIPAVRPLRDIHPIVYGGLFAAVGYLPGDAVQVTAAARTGEPLC